MDSNSDGQLQFKPASTSDLWKDRRERARHAKKQLFKLACVSLFYFSMIGVGSGIGLYCYSLPNDGTALEIALFGLRGMGAAILWGAAGFWLTLFIFAKVGFRLSKSNILLGGDTIKEVPGVIPKNPYRIARVVGLLFALAFSFVQGSDIIGDLDGFGAFFSALTGGLVALGLGHLLVRKISS